MERADFRTIRPNKLKDDENFQKFKGHQNSETSN